MTAVADVGADSPPVEDARPDARLASWPARAGALALDVLPGVGVLATLTLVALTVPPRGWLWWVYTVLAVLTVIAMAVNRYLLPTLTGWSLGRALFGIRVVRANAEAPAAGLGRLLARDLAHLLDTLAVFVGWLWPLWDRRNRTFADLLVRTEVNRVERPHRDMRRLTAMVLVGAVLVSGISAGLCYLVVYRAEQAVQQAREQIAEQGPRIVEQLLSYQADSIDEDFARAQSLATDTYRDQLAAQQQAVKLTDPTSNEYWSVSSAVLSAAPGEAAMLLAMQGQRGITPEELQFITATVRVDFQQAADGQWQVDNLVVLKQPHMEQGGQ